MSDTTPAERWRRSKAPLCWVLGCRTVSAHSLELDLEVPIQGGRIIELCDRDKALHDAGFIDLSTLTRLVP